MFCNEYSFSHIHLAVSRNVVQYLTYDCPLPPSLIQPNSEEIPLKEFRIPSKESCMQSETEALIEQDHESSQPASHYSPKLLSLLSERLEPSVPFLPSSPFSSAAFPRMVLPRSRSRETVGSLRRASSLDDLDSMRAESGRPGDPRSNSSEFVCVCTQSKV